MANNRINTHTLSLNDYIAFLAKLKEELMQDYGRRRRGFAGLWGKRNDELVTSTHIMGEPIDLIKSKFRTYQSRNVVSRFFIRVFTDIEKKQSLLQYHKTISALDTIMQQSIVSNNTVTRYLPLLDQPLNTQISRFSGLKSMLERLKMKLDNVTLLLPSSTNKPEEKIVASKQRTKTVVSPSFDTTSTGEKTLFLQAFETDMAKFRDAIEKEKQPFQSDSILLDEKTAHHKVLENKEDKQALLDSIGRIKKLYYKLSLQYHPDKVTEPLRTAAGECFKSIGALYTEATEELIALIEHEDLKKAVRDYRADVDDLVNKVEEERIALEKLKVLAQQCEEAVHELSNEVRTLAQETQALTKSLDTIQVDSRHVQQSYHVINQALDILLEINHRTEKSIQGTDCDMEDLTQRADDIFARFQETLKDNDRQQFIDDGLLPEKEKMRCR